MLISQIKQRRMEKHLSQREFAELLNISHVQLCRYEKGHAYPSLPVLFDMENILQCTLNDLFKKIN